MIISKWSFPRVYYHIEKSCVLRHLLWLSSCTTHNVNPAQCSSLNDRRVFPLLLHTKSCLAVVNPNHCMRVVLRCYQHTLCGFFKHLLPSGWVTPKHEQNKNLNTPIQVILSRHVVKRKSILNNHLTGYWLKVVFKSILDVGTRTANNIPVVLFSRLTKGKAYNSLTVPRW